jgi:hypothetical protein
MTFLTLDEVLEIYTLNKSDATKQIYRNLGVSDSNDLQSR